MRAALFRNGRFEVGETPEPPSPSAGQVLVEVLACGICESDLMVATRTVQFLRAWVDSGVGTYNFDPGQEIVMGHEFAGRVIEVGAGVSTVAVGDQVSGYGTVLDEHGVAQVAGYSNRYPGGFGERMLVQEASVQRDPTGLPADAATLAEPLSVGEKAVQRSNISPRDSTIVVGAGPVGLGAIAALTARGISPVIAVEQSPIRRALAENLGAQPVLHPADAVALWRSHYGGSPRVIAFDCSGESGTINKLLYALPSGSKIMVVAPCMTEDLIQPLVGVYKSIELNFQYGDTKDAYPTTLDRVASGAVDVAAMITGRVGLEGVAQAFRDLERPNEHVRIIVYPNGPLSESQAGSADVGRLLSSGSR